MGVRGDNEESSSEGGSKDSLEIEDMSLGSRNAGNDAMSLTSEQRDLVGYFEKDGESRPNALLGEAEDATDDEKNGDDPSNEKPHAPLETAPSAADDQAPENPQRADKVVPSTGTHESINVSPSDVTMNGGGDTAVPTPNAKS